MCRDEKNLTAKESLLEFAGRVALWGRIGSEANTQSN